jgi:lipopolysaccharide/colanic/teichoic acid biosynthesis glycosyltransferase
MDSKRIFDIAAGAFALIALSPFLLLNAALVRFFLGAPVFFRQERPGLFGVPFALIKFRTMTDSKDAEGRLLSDGDRLTRFGKLLRSTSIDELPELWNVIKGEMSIVGPRPLLLEYLPLYNAHQARRHKVKPGMTGWAQVNGRNATTWEERFKLDIWYVENQSFSLDLKIIWMTVRTVLNRRGIGHEGSATMEKFKGTPQADG